MNEIQNYQDIKKTIKIELNKVAESFVVIGFNLKQIRDGELYKQDGYDNINDFAKAEYNLSQSSVSRFIAINDKFSVDGESPRLLEQYEGYGYSKLSEMLTMEDDELSLVSIQTTRAEIRDIKQAKKEYENQDYAPAHNEAQTTENTETNDNYNSLNNQHFLIEENIIIGLFKEESNREILKELAAELKKKDKSELEQRASEIINPSGYRFYRKGMTIIVMEAEGIKHNKFGEQQQELTYTTLIKNITSVFDMAAEDPWVEQYGEPEPEPEPKKETKPEPKPEPTPEPEIKKAPSSDEPEEEVEESNEKAKEEPLFDIRECRVCGCTDDEACEGGCSWVEENLCSKCAEKTEEPEEKAEEETEEEFETVEADIVNTKPSMAEDECIYCKKTDPDPLHTHEYQLSIKHDGFIEIQSEKHIPEREIEEVPIRYCPMCGKRLKEIGKQI